jgi:hypothetical protein
VKPETCLTISCRLCNHAEHYVTCDSDSVAVEAAFLDQEKMLCFQAFDRDGLTRTITIQSADIRKITRTPLTTKERADMERQMKEKPLPKLTGVAPC